MSIVLTAVQAIEWIIRFLAVYVVIDTAEKLYNFRELQDKGLFSWRLLRTHRFFQARGSRLVPGKILEFQSWLLLLALRGLSGLWLLCLPQCDGPATGALLILFIVGSLMNFRQTPLGAETENRFALGLVGALLLRAIAPTELVTIACLWFIALQACISYVTAGATKWMDKGWRSGQGLLHVIHTPALVPQQRLVAFFRRHPRLGKWLAWATIAVECLFPLVLWVGAPYFWWFLGWGILFHLTIAVVLRLGKFFWVWVAAYPAIIFIAQ